MKLCNARRLAKLARAYTMSACTKMVKIPKNNRKEVYLWVIEEEDAQSVDQADIGPVAEKPIGEVYAFNAFYTPKRQQGGSVRVGPDRDGPTSPTQRRHNSLKF